MRIDGQFPITLEKKVIWSVPHNGTIWPGFQRGLMNLVKTKWKTQEKAKEPIEMKQIDFTIRISSPESIWAVHLNWRKHSSTLHKPSDSERRKHTDSALYPLDHWPTRYIYALTSFPFNILRFFSPRFSPRVPKEKKAKSFEVSLLILLGFGKLGFMVLFSMNEFERVLSCISNCVG